MRYRMQLAYDGTLFHGWQKQYQPASEARPTRANAPRDNLGDAGKLRHVGLAEEPLSLADGALTLGTSALPGDDRIELRTVQGVVERVLFDLLRQRVRVLGASRTDAGVHARAQTAAFDTEEPRLGPTDDVLARALNSRLPIDIRCEACQPVDDDFDPISSCQAKGYRYSLWVSETRPLWHRRYVRHVVHEVDVEQMQRAAELLIGEHDFAGFAQVSHGRETTVRTIHHCGVERRADEPRIVDITVSGDGFLYNMVRIIAGTLVEVGRGRFDLDRVQRALETGDRREAGPTLGASGLCLEWGRYPAPVGVVGEAW